MYDVTQEYKELILADSTRHALHVYIDGTEIDSKYILDFKVKPVLFENDEFCFGNTPQRTCELKIHKDALPDEYDEFYITTGIETTSLTEIVPIGYFYKDDIAEKDSYTITLDLGDKMSEFDEAFDGSELNYPITNLELLQAICDKHGIELGSTSFTNSDSEISVYDSTVTARTYIGYIAELAGGFATIGRDNKLYIRQVGDNTISFITVAELDAMTVAELDSLEVSLEVYKLASSNGYSQLLLKYFSEYEWGDEFIISRVAYEDGIQDFKTGDETAANTVWLDSNNMFVSSQEQIDNIYNDFANAGYYSFSGTSIVDPAWDIGDVIEVDGKNIIFQGTMSYKGKFKAEFDSEIKAKTQESSMQTTVSDTTKIRRVQSSIDQIEGTITQVVEEVKDQSEKISEVIQTVDSITDTISSVETKVETVEKTVDSTVESIETVQAIAENAQSTADTAQETADNAVAQITTTTTKLTEVEETVDGITQTVSSVEETVNNLEVGSRNLLLATATQDTSKGNYQNSVSLTGGTFLGCQIFQSRGAWADIGFKLKRVIEDNELQLGDVLTYSIYTKTVNILTVAGVNKTTVQNVNEMTLNTLIGNEEIEFTSKNITCYTDPSTSGTSSRKLATFTDVDNTEWKRLIVTFAIDETMMNYLSSSNLPTRFEYTTASPAGVFQYWAAPQLEKGTIATYYAPAPEDTEDAIEVSKTEMTTVIEQTATSITSTVDEKLILYATLENLSDMEDKIINEEVLDLLADYITETNLTDVLETYVTSVEMSTSIEQTESSILSTVNTSLEAYVTTTNLDNTLSSYSTTLQMNSAISQTQSNILNTVSSTYTTITDTETLSKTIEASLELKVNTENLISEINASADVITLTSNRISITSDYFTLTKDGQITATSGTIGGFTLGTTSFSSDFSGIYDYNNWDLLLACYSVLGVCTLDGVLTDILDVNDSGAISASDYVLIKNIISGTKTNTKTISGTLEINTQNSKNNIVVEKDGTQVVSIGAGGINTNLLISDIICCGYSGGTTSSSYGVVIDSQQSVINVIESGTTKVQISSSGVTTSSDRTLKENIIELEEDYTTLLTEINPISFNYINNDKKHFGFIAQDVEEVFNNNNIEQNITTINDKGIYMMNYTELIPVMWKILQEQNKRITKLEEKIDG